MLAPGDIVELDLMRKEENPEWQGWVWCKAGNREGWVPVQILEFQKERTVTSAKVTRHYSAAELNVEEGDLVVIDEILNGWAWVRNISNQEEGWIPMQILG